MWVSYFHYYPVEALDVCQRRLFRLRKQAYRALTNQELETRRLPVLAKIASIRGKLSSLFCKSHRLGDVVPGT
ncbi:hypothetical protein DPMN_151688 [Dreissena polymorpha]|uniref:Uncharacterized protein n=1 Tax=Dreissena polymorpha TaxID=45954 RepID=A0A9D4FFU1_DREPO|nr:hypothetical protein DPMN_151688 [Dreissena polymorpha]